MALNHCIDCGSDAYYRVVTTDSYGPSKEISRSGKGNLCREHANERAAKAYPGWKARQDAKKAKTTASHAKFLAAYNEARQIEDPFEGLV